MLDELKNLFTWWLTTKLQLCPFVNPTGKSGFQIKWAVLFADLLNFKAIEYLAPLSAEMS